MRKTYETCFREFISERRLDFTGAAFTKPDVLRWFAESYPSMPDVTNQFWKKTTNYAGRVQWKPKPIGDDLFFQLDDEEFRVYRPGSDPTPIYVLQELKENKRFLTLTSTDAYYNYRNCQSLFGYAKTVHERSGCVCQLCGCGDGHQIDFDLWRQMTVEHLIGSADGGYLKQIQSSIRTRFPELSGQSQDEIARRIDELNTITACHFCNSTTSQYRHHRSMTSLIAETKADTGKAICVIKNELEAIMEQKRSTVEWKCALSRTPSKNK